MKFLWNGENGLTFWPGINAFLYMTLGRMVQFFVPEQQLVKISAQRFGLIFVCLDIVAFIIQLIGVAILTKTDADTDTVLRQVSKMTNLSFNWRWLFYTMYFALTMITVGRLHTLPPWALCFNRLTDSFKNRCVSPFDWPNIHMVLVQMSPRIRTNGTNMSSMLYLCFSLSLFSMYFTPVAFSKGPIQDSDTRRKSPRWKKDSENFRRKMDMPQAVIWMSL